MPDKSPPPRWKTALRQAPLAALVAALPVTPGAGAQADPAGASAQRTPLQERVAAVRAALAMKTDVATETPAADATPAPKAAQSTNWTNWPKWSKWSNWANK